MGIVPGERVKYLNEKGGGVVVKVLSDGRVEVLDDDGLNLVFNRSELVGERSTVPNAADIASRWKDKMLRSGEKMQKSDHLSPDMQDYLLSSRQKWTGRNKDFIEVDLHIEEIVDVPSKFRDGEKLLIQLHYAARCIDEARHMRIPRVIFIHGVGAGVLRRELCQWLTGLGDVEFHNADFASYGLGATEVRLRGLYR